MYLERDEIELEEDKMYLQRYLDYFQKVDEMCDITHSVVTKAMIAAIDKTMYITTKFRSNFSESHQDVMYLIETVYFPWFNILQTSYVNFEDTTIKSIMSCSDAKQIKDFQKDISNQVKELKENVEHVWDILKNVEQTAVLYNISLHAVSLHAPSFINVNFCNESILFSQLDGLIKIISEDSNAICEPDFKTLLHKTQTLSKELWNNCIHTIQHLFQYRENFLSGFYAEVGDLKHNIIEVDKVTPRQQADQLHESFRYALRMLDFLENNTISASTYFYSLIDVLDEASANVTDFVNNIEKLKSNKLEMIKQDFFQAIDSLESSKDLYRSNFSNTFLGYSHANHDENDQIEAPVPSFIFELSNASVIVSYINDLHTLQEVLKVLDDVLTSYDKMYLALSPPIDRALEQLKDYANKFSTSLEIDFDFVMYVYIFSIL